ncbi:MAG: hypothetical protein KJ063_19950 [Anaerolineae bacterium]|nr:hypothetical protein [Anaerolineae bacterium]
MSHRATRFIERWQQSAAAERANYTLFLSELCPPLLPAPDWFNLRRLNQSGLGQLPL